MGTIFYLGASDKQVLQGSVLGPVLFKHHYQSCGGGDGVHPHEGYQMRPNSGEGETSDMLEGKAAIW